MCFSTKLAGRLFFELKPYGLSQNGYGLTPLLGPLDAVCPDGPIPRSWTPASPPQAAVHRRGGALHKSCACGFATRGSQRRHQHVTTQRRSVLYKQTAASMTAGCDTASVSRTHKRGHTAVPHWDHAAPSATKRDHLKIAPCRLNTSHGLVPLRPSNIRAHQS